MKYEDTSILIFCKAPISGSVKTRLIPTLGEDGACALHRALAERLINEVIASNLAEVVLYCWPDISHEFFTSFKKIKRIVQKGDNLGERMHHAFNEVLSVKDNVILIGTDCPSINAGYLDRAIVKLLNHDAVLGPAEDGGYGLIGLHESHWNYFKNLVWGSSQICSETCRRFNQARLEWSLMPLIWDVDRPEDVGRYFSSESDS
ncbi:MAG: TIGR04282 family arsenosugar biosynthesis glycosyltransferase [Candidatus Azotimanducaceae bacterium]|uniref:Glycosyltransferase n=1 Tax=OM182 bacterium TaxID=2510334 RepID=A0A520RZJ9_9GAMM|nr:flagellar biosynthesis protein FlgB [Gammaproteobacteria bacterium]OUV68835.1 MAG: hypothetical protein CBC93_00450 [Gammaproteobacteria bacterium TMED133]RZO75662.1 MAG: glycosyltransferase [OM182 bacterium]